MAEGGASAPPNDDTANANYECNICLETAREAVVSRCGHLFCWPCLYKWFEARPNRKMCPVCKAGVSPDQVIPLYGRGSTDNKDPREKLPPRPQAQRTEPENTSPFGNFGNLSNLQMSFGIGAFPFSFFATSFNLTDQRPSNPNMNTQQYEEEQVLSKMFLFVALFFTAWLILA